MGRKVVYSVDMAAKRGRPPKVEGEVRTTSLHLRISPTEREEIGRLAAELDLSVTDLVLLAAREYHARKKNLTQ